MVAAVKLFAKKKRKQEEEELTVAPTEDKNKKVFVSNVAPPEPFNILQPECWIKWRKKFKRYMSVSG